MGRVLELRSHIIAGHAVDEPLGGKTLKGTPITSRIPECFPTEPRDLFWQMDMVPDGEGANSHLRPLNFDINGDGKIDDTERNAIRGRNTWVLWSCGNEGFWNWLTQDGYGITDFLVLLDSRTRTNRFVRAGLINQPGFKSNSDPSNTVLGLYLDVPVDDTTPNSDLPDGYASRGHVLQSPPWDHDVKRVEPPKDHTNLVNFALFKPGDPDFYTTNMAKIKAMGDGVDYSVYGYPSGVVGLRLFPNPDFFGTGPGPKKARAYWATQVQANPDNYYTNSHINQDPKLVRPFRVGMSCGFCHIAPHPLNPPKDPEAPDWANLSTTIGNQFWKPQPAFAVLQETNSFIFHFLASQQPGTIDTSLVSSDQINNANTINAVFEVNARLARAMLNPEERQSAANVRLRSIEDKDRPILPDPSTNNFRHTPRVLLDGSDSIGVFGALARVYLNIGTFYEEWSRCDNLFVGFKKQTPFLVEVCQSNSVYWQVNERYRAGYLADFFTMAYGPATNGQSYQGVNPPCKAPHTSTQPMKLIAAKDGDGQTPSMAAQSALALNSSEQRKHGREVWLNNCAICHSSKQPDGFALSFERKKGGEPWYSQPAPKDANYVLPMDQADWVAFKSSPSYEDYKTRLRQLVEKAQPLDGDPMTDNHPFWIENYLSTDIRVPLTLAGTPSGRALASNGLKGHVWGDFSSITYKELPAVGAVAYFNPISATGASFDAPGGGRGYYRPATQVSLWATAPYLHNNALGVYLDDPSVKGRLVQFFDGIRRVLWSSKRASPSLALSDKEFEWLRQVQEKEKAAGAHSSEINTNMDTRHYGDLRGLSTAAANDDGFIYRLPNDTYVEFAPGFIRPLVEGVAGPFLTKLLTVWLWVALVVLLLWLAWQSQPRQLGIVFIALALLLLLPLALSGTGGGASAMGMLLMSLATFLPFTIWGWGVIALTLVVAGVICIEVKPCNEPNPHGWWAARLVVVTLLAGIGVALLMSHAIWVGLIALVVALLIWFALKWTLPEITRVFFILLTVAAVLAGIAAHQFVNGRPIAFIPFTHVAMEPLPIKLGPIPLGTPVNLIMNINPESPKLPQAVVSMTLALAEIKQKGLSKEPAWRLFSQRAGQALMDASTCPDFVLDRGHLFGETLDPDPNKNDQDKEDLIAFLKTL
jgi:mono/diheme cytochrome c family protein